MKPEIRTDMLWCNLQTNSFSRPNGQHYGLEGFRLKRAPATCKTYAPSPLPQPCFSFRAEPLQSKNWNQRNSNKHKTVQAARPKYYDRKLGWRNNRNKSNMFWKLYVNDVNLHHILEPRTIYTELKTFSNQIELTVAFLHDAMLWRFPYCEQLKTKTKHCMKLGVN